MPVFITCLHFFHLLRRHFPLSAKTQESTEKHIRPKIWHLASSNLQLSTFNLEPSVATTCIHAFHVCNSFHSRFSRQKHFPFNPLFFFVSSRENDGRAQIHLNPPNLVNPVKKSALLEFSFMVENIDFSSPEPSAIDPDRSQLLDPQHQSTFDRFLKSTANRNTSAQCHAGHPNSRQRSGLRRSHVALLRPSPNVTTPLCRPSLSRTDT